MLNWPFLNRGDHLLRGWLPKLLVIQGYIPIMTHLRPQRNRSQMTLCLEYKCRV